MHNLKFPQVSLIALEHKIDLELLGNLISYMYTVGMLKNNRIW